MGKTALPIVRLDILVLLTGADVIAISPIPGVVAVIDLFVLEN
jgi:hypothetical protein